MRKKISFIIACLLAAGLLIYCLISLYQLAVGSYYINESKLYKIDTFHLLNRAFEESDLSTSRYGSPRLVFESRNRYSFAIEKFSFKAITDKKKLEDTLMYHDLKFTVYSSKKYFDKYHQSKPPMFIRVLQIQIGDTNYIDIQKMNKLYKEHLLRAVLIPPAFVFFFGFLLYKQNENDKWWTKKRIIQWILAFVITITIFLLLT